MKISQLLAALRGSTESSDTSPAVMVMAGILSGETQNAASISERHVLHDLLSMKSRKSTARRVLNGDENSISRPISVCTLSRCSNNDRLLYLK